MTRGAGVVGRSEMIVGNVALRAFSHVRDMMAGFVFIALLHSVRRMFPLIKY